VRFSTALRKFVEIFFQILMKIYQTCEGILWRNNFKCNIKGKILKRKNSSYLFQ
jgi:hypothetical protein